MFEKIRKLFRKQKAFPCIIWDGKVIKYLDLTQKQIDKMQEKNKNLMITKKEDC
ncbi:MAG: hypothetical protein PHE16_03530 [Aliarcobacter sp.]|nr:hypothetical protein [Aliarcobacter sp.]